VPGAQKVSFWTMPVASLDRDNLHAVCAVNELDWVESLLSEVFKVICDRSHWDVVFCEEKDTCLIYVVQVTALAVCYYAVCYLLESFVGLDRKGNYRISLFAFAVSFETAKSTDVAQHGVNEKLVVAKVDDDGGVSDLLYFHIGSFVWVFSSICTGIGGRDHSLYLIPSPIILNAKKKGSSPNSGESCPYFEEEIFIVEKAISHSFYHFDFVVDAFK
jgi:hypothetical protein